MTSIIEPSIFNDLYQLLERNEQGSLDPFLNQFFQVIKDSLDKIYSALDTKDYETIHRLAHTLKGTCSTFGATQFASQWEALDAAAVAGDVKGIADLLHSVEASFPIVKLALLQARDENARQFEPAATAEQKKTLVLVVEDEAIARHMLRRILEAEGYQVEEAADGAQALERCISLAPDIVLLDALLPKIDGFTVCSRLQSLGDTAVIMITGLHDEQSINRAFEAGATDFVTKPIEWSALLRRMQHILHVRETERELSRVRAELTDVRSRQDGITGASHLSGNAATLFRAGLAIIDECTSALMTQELDEQSRQHSLVSIQEQTRQLRQLLSDTPDR